jgi:hypothetical protein
MTEVLRIHERQADRYRWALGALIDERVTWFRATRSEKTVHLGIFGEGYKWYAVFHNWQGWNCSGLDWYEDSTASRARFEPDGVEIGLELELIKKARAWIKEQGQ